MARTLICIGCNKYDHCGDLHAAETDAQRLFQTLTKEESAITTLCGQSYCYPQRGKKQKEPLTTSCFRLEGLIH